MIKALVAVIVAAGLSHGPSALAASGKITTYETMALAENVSVENLSRENICGFLALSILRTISVTGISHVLT